MASGNPGAVQKPRKGLFYVFAFVPDDEPNRFFVMDQRTANRLLDQHRAKASANSPTYRWGILWPVVEDYEDNWRALPDYRRLPQSK
jgi:hypothetical protein